MSMVSKGNANRKGPVYKIIQSILFKFCASFVFLMLNRLDRRTDGRIHEWMGGLGNTHFFINSQLKSGRRKRGFILHAELKRVMEKHEYAMTRDKTSLVIHSRQESFRVRKRATLLTSMCAFATAYATALAHALASGKCSHSKIATQKTARLAGALNSRHCVREIETR